MAEYNTELVLAGISDDVATDALLSKFADLHAALGPAGDNTLLILTVNADSLSDAVACAHQAAASRIGRRIISIRVLLTSDYDADL